MSEVAVIIPNYNGIKYIGDCLDSLLAQTMRADIIVVDNASEDGAVDIVRGYRDIKLIELPENYGFCRAVNEGIAAADAKYVILLNNDTKAEPDFVEELYKAIDGRDDTFSVASRMLQMNSPDRIDSAGDLYCALGWAFSVGKDKHIDKYNKESVVFSACAGAAIYRKEVFDRIGYFDEIHVSYLEDVDVGYRARISGYVNRYTPKAVVYHVGSASSGSRHNPFKVRLTAQNSVYIIYKNMPLLQILLNIPFLLAGFGIKAVFFMIKGYGREYVSGVIQGFGKCKRGRRYPFNIAFLGNYFRIQLELWFNTLRRIFG